MATTKKSAGKGTSGRGSTKTAKRTAKSVGAKKGARGKNAN